MIAVAHADLIVADVPRALGFWVDLLGGAVADDAIVDGEVPAFYTGGRATRMRLVMIRLARFGAMIELMAFEPPLPTTPGGVHVTLQVDDLVGTRARLAAAGIEAVGDVMAVALPRLGAARIAFVRDPDGYLVELVEPA
ncbi:MAG: VOC family protein [Myxococcales bacterium]|nr:VOC family protein [Myxococcales bacterium]